jgi:predicted nucleic acid-binding protein
MVKERLYWDSSCFISYLSASHPDEIRRAEICKDILKHAQNDDVEIWTSVWSIVETIRPKEKYQAQPLPKWSILLDARNKDGSLQFPTALAQLEKIWNYYHRHTLPSRRISAAEASEIQRIFNYPFIRKIQIEPTIANRAAEIARDKNIKPGDALHVASALARQCIKIQRWDHDFQKTDDLIPSEEPQRVTPQELMFFPPSDFRLTAPNEEPSDEREEKASDEREADPAHPAPVRGSDDGRAKGEATGKAPVETEKAEAPEKPKAASEGGLGEKDGVTEEQN